MHLFVCISAINLTCVQYIREYTEAIQATEEEEEEEESPPEREVPSTNELPDEDEEQLALLQRTATNVLSSIQQDLTQLRMELEVHGADAGYESRILQIAKIASLIKKVIVSYVCRFADHFDAADGRDALAARVEANHRRHTVPRREAGPDLARSPVRIAL